jgi:hypothetical protein
MDHHLTRPTELACLDDVEGGGLASILGRRMSRRRGLAVLTGGATALLSGVASACGIIQLAPCSLNAPDCCNLATCIECAWEGSKDQYTCKDGWHPSYWTCIDELGNTVVCGECAWGTSTSCFTGPFDCSIWY